MSKTTIPTGGITADAIDATLIADDAISDEHLDITAITGQTALAAAPASTDEFLINDGGTLKRIDASYIGGTNSGFFYVYKNSLSVASATNTIVTGWSETFDLDNWFASDKYTPQEAGKYVFFYSARADNIGATARFFVALKKNGSGLDHNGAETNIVSASYPSLNAAFVVDMNGSSDYIQSEIYHNQGSTSDFFDIYLQGFKLIT